MIIRNGIKSTLRARGRSFLFTVLILLMCLSLTLGAGMWAYCTAQLELLNENYTSIALVEYMGADYPNEDAADSFVRDAAQEIDIAAITALEGVESWESNDRALGYVEAYVPGGAAPYENYAVIEFTQFSEYWGDGSIYCAEDEIEAPYIAINPTDNTAKVCNKDAVSAWVPYYVEDSGKFYQQNIETGERTALTKAELPEEYVRLTQNKNYYYTDGVHEYTIFYVGGPGSSMYVEGRYFSTVYTYDPATELYETTGDVLQGYAAISNEIFYARGMDSSELAFTNIELGDSGFVAEKGHRYTLHGQFVASNTGNSKFLITDFYEGCEIPPYQDTTDREPDPIFMEYASLYENGNNYVALEASDDIASLELFHQNVFKLSEGRFPAAGEAGVCLVSGDIARQLELDVGDSISLEVFDSGESNRFDLGSTGDVRSLEVVGITTRVTGYYGNVWVSSAEGCFGEELFGYQLGRAVLDNASALETVEAMQGLCPDGVRVTLFDQGYAAAAQPLETMLSTASAVTLASALGALAVIFLFAYLFVGRQRETVNVLVSLGTPGIKISLWLLSGAVLISGFASAIGAWAGYEALGHIIELAFAAASSMYVVDDRFSESVVGIVKETVGAGETSAEPAIAAFVFVFALSLVLCWIFLFAARKKTTPKRGRVSVRVPRGKSSYWGRGALRFARLSARRGGWRSAVVPVVALVLSMFLGILATASTGWNAQIDALYRDAEISGRATSVNGRSSSNLTIPADTVREIQKSGYVENTGVALGFNYWLDEDMPAFSSSGFGIENRDNWISVQPDIVALNRLSAAPEFIHSRTPEVEWLDGWDESFLSDPDACSALYECMNFYERGEHLNATKEPDVVACLAPRAFLESHGLKLGDEFDVNIILSFKSENQELRRTMKVVGTFTQLGDEANLYVPLALWCDEAWITGEEEIIEPGQQFDTQFSSAEERDDYFYNTTRFSTCVFTLTSANALEPMRDFLVGEGFSQVNRMSSNRTTILLYDRSFVETISGLNRYISFSQLLFPVLFVLVAVLGFIISWLMVNSRRMEFAILRGLGASKLRVFCSFFYEQAMLCIIGGILGCAALWYLTGGFGWWQAVAVFAGCYLLGAALSVSAVGRTHLMSLLSERE